MYSNCHMAVIGSKEHQWLKIDFNRLDVSKGHQESTFLDKSTILITPNKVRVYPRTKTSKS